MHSAIVGGQGKDKRKESYKKIFYINKRWGGGIGTNLSTDIAKYYFMFSVLNLLNINLNNTVIYIAFSFIYFASS